MRAHEIIVETTEEDRAIISLSRVLCNYVRGYFDTDPDYTNPEEKLWLLGKISDIVDTPLEILNNVALVVQDGNALSNSSSPLAGGHVKGAWDSDGNRIIINVHIIDTPDFKTIITHELRHALDDYKSGFVLGDNAKYFTPKRKEYKTDSYLSYIAEPAEINARFLEIMHRMMNYIPMVYLKSQPDKIKFNIKALLNQMFMKYSIAEIFPERTESRDYKRLVKRAMDMLHKEMTHYENTKDVPKATGNW
jgi:hypothetical protein